MSAAQGGGEILVSDVVRGLLAGKDHPFGDKGGHALKGFEEPVRPFEGCDSAASRLARSAACSGSPGQTQP